MGKKEQKPLQNASENKDLAPFKPEQDFQFVQLSSNIHDQKFQTKPTTFLRDAMHRFVKSRSALVAAIILGVIVMMAIFVPIIDQNDVSDSYILSDAKFLPPKWWNGTSGFLDGTQQKKDVVMTYDTTASAYVPANQNTDASGYDLQYIVGGVKGISTYKSIMNATSTYGHGGSMMITPAGSTDTDVYGGVYSTAASFETTKAYGLTITFDQTACNASSPKASYALYLLADLNSDLDYESEILIQDYGTDYTGVSLTDFMPTVVASSVYQASSKPNVFSAKFNIRVTNTKTNPYPNLYVNSFVASSVDYPNLFDHINWTEGNEVILRDTETNANYAYRWQINGNGYKRIYGVEVTLGTFRYDLYSSAFGEVTRTISKSDFLKYVNQGWCTYNFDVKDFKTGADKPDGYAFTITDDGHCPIRDVYAQSTITYKGVTAVSFSVKLSKYRFDGFTSIPRYLFGTDDHGRDYFKYLFGGLRISLLLGVLTAVVNISIGLVWGAVSGYFGGWTDIIMERFTEILGGVPWIVIMTLVILKMGSSFWTFVLALCLTGWIGMAAETREQFYRFKGREYVLASRTLGASDGRLIFRHILPNGIGTIITGAVMEVPSVIFSEATISYLGLGLTGLGSFGVALSYAQGFIATYPYMIICGSIIMCVMMISFNLFGNGLRDAFNPSLKGVSE
ncbi:MAG: Oligopeptide transport system permease protein OppC [Tenericutes bacterium ADurb.BinA155]|nr:MAG: Oligopeptide transport system permease protein OppC [Tenericutes bacterium ADurb.BinA155]